MKPRVLIEVFAAEERRVLSVRHDRLGSEVAGMMRCGHIVLIRPDIQRDPHLMDSIWCEECGRVTQVDDIPIIYMTDGKIKGRCLTCQ